ncbi:competence/damage-inducible protein A [Fusibacter paucivorans]|uniref:Putative competence-damage inducible protein n=1 Tax=Fusibacter paucivorans TaxID=76009 RepID=A0ABS5PS48_9FIRM|nr:competence/damage-inducible protein A [Fusibacter paucivorans]MBS7527995.1 competence/damage-inducible protein A [Fusibacter paucivorans]
MIAGILAVGTELLMGQTVNTNATFLSEQLNHMGISVYYHMTVGDNRERMKVLLNQLLNECDIVFTTGGLGPTQDDITKEVVAEALGLEMIYDERSMQRIRERFKLYNRKMTDSNVRQAYFPKGAIILDNDEGTAPACIVEVPSRDKIVYVLPGPPREMKHIFNRHMINDLLTRNQMKMHSAYLSVYDLGESSTEDRLLDLIDRQTDPTIATYAGEGKVLVRVTSFNKDETYAQKAVRDMVETIKERIGEFIVSESGEDINDVIVNRMRALNQTIAFAESCTGGKLADALIKVPGASNVVNRGYVTYSNEAKIEDLKVSEETLKRFGAVSHETCLEMVKGLKERTDADLCVSITGIAGPDGGTDEKPVGLVYIGISYNGQTYTLENRFRGNRSMIRQRAMNTTLKLIYDLVKEA